MIRRLFIVAATVVMLVVLAAMFWKKRAGDSRARSEPESVTLAGNVVPEIARASRAAKPVIFIGLDGADWQLLDRYMADGVMPNLRGLVSDGTAGTLETIHPALSPLVWTSMMTGVNPVRHGILDFTRFNPTTGNKEPITSDERKAPAIWNMESWAGRRVAVFGLWATYPAEPVDGLMVSDRLFTFLFKEDRPPEGVVFPREQDPWARDVMQRVDREVDPDALKAYLPWLTDDAYRAALASADPYSDPVGALRRTLVETRVYDALAREWIARSKPDLSVIYIQGTDSIGHTFAPFAPPRQPSIEQGEYDKYSGVPAKYFGEIDRMIGAYRDLAVQQGAVLMLASDHGFTWAEDRPSRLSSNAQSTAAKWHRKEGIYLLWGPGIARRGRDAGARGSVQQICSTLLSLTGLPPASGLDGPSVLPGSPESPTTPVNYTAYYHPPAAVYAAAVNRKVDEDTLARLRALGYIGAAESTATRQIGATRTAGSYNNAGLVLKAQGKKTEAIEAFENALIVDPNLASALWNLSDMLFEDNRDVDRSDLLLVHAFAEGLPEGTKFLIGRAIGYERAGQLDRSMKLLEAAVRAKPEEPEVWLFLGRYRVEAGKCGEAVADFEKATRLAPKNAGAFASLGLARLCAGDTDGARRELRHSLELDGSQPAVKEYLRKLGD
jgi:tetratricopeptide (TPR) repeat protein